MPPCAREKMIYSTILTSRARHCSCRIDEFARQVLVHHSGSHAVGCVCGAGHFRQEVSRSMWPLHLKLDVS